MEGEWQLETASQKIISVGKIGKSLSHSISNVYLVDGLQHNLLSVSQLCARGNYVGFSFDQYLITNIITKVLC